jgi:amino acid transporter
MSIMTATIRLCFGMARDNQLPFSKGLAKVNPNLHTPVWSCIAVAVVSAIPFIQFTGATIIAVAATAMIYLSWFLGGLAVLRARMKGWPKTPAPFKLGRWGIIVNVIGLLWGAAMLVNFLWPATSSSSLRTISNPKASQTAGAVNYHIGFLNAIPVIELVMIVVIVIGAIYYLLVQRNKPYTAPVIPDDVDTATPPAVSG